MAAVLPAAELLKTDFPRQIWQSCTFRHIKQLSSAPAKNSPELLFYVDGTPQQWYDGANKSSAWETSSDGTSDFPSNAREESPISSNDHLLAAILDVGEAMLEAGAEVSRVETTIQLLSSAYGFSDINVFTILFSIVVTVTDPDGRILTQTRRIARWNTNLNRIEQLNALSRWLCAHPAPAEDITAEVERICGGPHYSQLVHFLLYLICPLVLTLFFRGTLPDAVASAACGAVLWLVDLLMRRLEIRNLVRCFFCSVTVGLCAVGCSSLFPALHMDKVVIGNIMMLIPGMALTVSLRDMINGDIITGLLNFCDAVLRAIIIAIGIALAPMLLGGSI